jgi:predicted dehydrogenase
VRTKSGKLAKIAAKVGIADTSSDWESFVGRDDLHVISVATPTSLHHDMTWPRWTPVRRWYVKSRWPATSMRRETWFAPPGRSASRRHDV